MPAVPAVTGIKLSPLKIWEAKTVRQVYGTPIAVVKIRDLSAGKIAQVKGP